MRSQRLACARHASVATANSLAAPVMPTEVVKTRTCRDCSPLWPARPGSLPPRAHRMRARKPRFHSTEWRGPSVEIPSASPRPEGHGMFERISRDPGGFCATASWPSLERILVVPGWIGPHKRNATITVQRKVIVRISWRAYVSPSRIGHTLEALLSIITEMHREHGFRDTAPMSCYNEHASAEMRPPSRPNAPPSPKRRGTGMHVGS